MLILLGLLSLLVFVVPMRWKYGLTLGVVGAGALAGIAVGVASLSGIIQQCGLLFYPAFVPVDGLSAIFLLIICVGAVAVTLYARDYLKPYTSKKSPVHFSLHYTALVWMFLSMIGVVLCRDTYPFLTCWELMTLASFVLILFEGEKRETRRTAINYLILMHIGFVFLVAGFVVSSQGGLLGGFDGLASYFQGRNPIPVFLLFLIGFGMKAGIFPLHVWLPEAHPAAPSHVSALMSGVMIKMGVYGILRVVAAIDTGLQTVGIILLCTGIVTALWGIVQASLQNDLKKLLAYSSIENIGILFIGIGSAAWGLSVGNTPLAVLGMAGALLHTVNHSLFKPLLFMSAGAVYTATHTRNLDELGGLSQRMPITTALFLVGSVAICALPPLNGFVSEFLIYLGLLRSVAMESGIIWAVGAMLALALVGGVAILVFSKALGIGFLGAPRSVKASHASEVGGLMLSAQMIPLAGMVLIGLFPIFITRTMISVVLELFSADFSQVGTISLWSGNFQMLSRVMFVLLGLIVLLWFLRRQTARRKVIAEGPTWGCGFTAPNARMQYTGESFSEGLQHLTNSPTNARSFKNRRAGAAVPKDEIFATEREFGVRHKDRIDRIVSERWVYLVRKLNARLALFQTGRINHYVLHALLFLAFVFLLTWIGWI
ncbi:MAG: NADH-quinone oxidoreductase subunit E [Rikenellaceae bacterium]|jgi:formate hydrogenlyase subunit 3/multisubunit Na+/H+ antiporter MnhD subunit|nr:NADH-quinone oxidoreductase subunit E [Rikenellaceae bacterium]